MHMMIIDLAITNPANTIAWKNHFIRNNKANKPIVYAKSSSIAYVLL